ncbi:E3 ubiquitin-protein like [Thalictrum thalictroides]|uniref:E3 ubiquitin-protein like n=1 Tax=Thalictrum thalictroides TaxID=46969 RepID=A0A7J6WBW4_THATH|nr:E3 ubiquitin-protein like [Thalictrum thalictroides]
MIDGWLIHSFELVPNDCRTGDISETEPILPQSNTLDRSTDYSSSCEIRPLGENCFVNDQVEHGLDVDEHSNLVNASQPLCRICLDIEGECSLIINHYQLYTNMVKESYEIS